MTCPRYCGQCGRSLDAAQLTGAPCPSCGCWWIVFEPVVSPELVRVGIRTWALLIVLIVANVALIAIGIAGVAR